MENNNTAAVVSKVWSLSDILRDIGIPAEFNWKSLTSNRGAEKATSP